MLSCYVKLLSWQFCPLTRACYFVQSTNWLVYFVLHTVAFSRAFIFSLNVESFMTHYPHRASVYDVWFLWSYAIVCSMKVIQSIIFLVALMQAVCIYLNKSFQTLLCNTHVFCFAFVYLCRIKPFEVEVEVDLSKAFDCLPHRLLLCKLHAYGVSRDACSLLHSYLSSRFQRVKISASRSDWVQMTKGVPQGSILGPMLFNIFINDLIYAVNDVCPLYNYADDNTLAFFPLIWKFWGQNLKKAPI